LAGTAVLTRTVTSVLATSAEWTVNISAPAGFSVNVSPEIFSLEPGASQTVLVSVTRQTSTPYDEWKDGAIVWTSSTGIKARIPVVLKAAELAVSPPGIKITNRTATYTFNVIPDWTVQPGHHPSGNAGRSNPARECHAAVLHNGVQSVTITCPPATSGTHLRIRLYNSDMPQHQQGTKGI